MQATAPTLTHHVSGRSSTYDPVNRSVNMEEEKSMAGGHDLVILVGISNRTAKYENKFTKPNLRLK